MEWSLSKPLFKKVLLASVFFLLFVIPEAKAQKELKLEADQRYLILSTKRISTMEKELVLAAAEGFRVLTGSPTSSLEMALFLERVASAEQPYDYRILATSRSKTMEKELNNMGRENFRALPQTFISKEGMFKLEILVVMERPPEPRYSYEYRVVDAVRTPTLQREIGAALKDGFSLIAMVTLGEHIVILEKESEIGP
jgi:hypothetical protein